MVLKRSITLCLSVILVLILILPVSAANSDYEGGILDNTDLRFYNRSGQWMHALTDNDETTFDTVSRLNDASARLTLDGYYDITGFRLSATGLVGIRFWSVGGSSLWSTTTPAKDQFVSISVSDVRMVEIFSNRDANQSVQEIEIWGTKIREPIDFSGGLLDGVGLINARDINYSGGINMLSTDNDETTFMMYGARGTSTDVFHYTFSEDKTIGAYRNGMFRVGSSGGISLNLYDASSQLLYSEPMVFYSGELVSLDIPVSGVRTIALVNTTTSSNLSLSEFNLYEEGHVSIEPPTSVFGVSGDSQVSLSWNPSLSLGVQGYNLYQDGVRVNSDVLTSTSYIVTGLTNGRGYTFTLTSVSFSGAESSESEPVFITPYITRTIDLNKGFNVVTERVGISNYTNVRPVDYNSLLPYGYDMQNFHL